MGMHIACLHRSMLAIHMTGGNPCFSIAALYISAKWAHSFHGVYQVIKRNPASHNEYGTAILFGFLSLLAICLGWSTHGFMASPSFARLALKSSAMLLIFLTAKSSSSADCAQTSQFIHHSGIPISL